MPETYHLFAPPTAAAGPPLHGPRAGNKTTEGVCGCGVGKGKRLQVVNGPLGGG